jgi:hypothetical protein
VPPLQPEEIGYPAFAYITIFAKPWDFIVPEQRTAGNPLGSQTLVGLTTAAVHERPKGRHNELCPHGAPRSPSPATPGADVSLLIASALST